MAGNGHAIGTMTFEVASPWLARTVGWVVPGLAVTLGCFFYATGNFGLLNILDLRREVQALLGALVIVFAPLALWHSDRWLRHPLWWLTLITLAGEVLVRRDRTLFFLIDRLTAVFIVALVLSLSYRFQERVLRVIVVLAGIFSVMVIVQAMAVWMYPETLDSFVLAYTSTSQASRVVVGHDLEYLGFITPWWRMTLFGHPFPKFRSFASEPSVLVYTFLAPGLVALTLRGGIRWLAAPILFFVVGLAASGTVYLCLLLGVVAWVVFHLSPRSSWALTIGPFAVIAGFFALLMQVNVRDMMIAITEFFGPLHRYYPVFDKIGSGTARLEPVVKHLQSAPGYLLFGSPVQARGLLLGMLTYAGAIGLVAGVLASYRVLASCVSALRSTTGWAKLGVALFHGTFVQVLFFSDYGWMTMSGFMLLVLTMEHFRRLASAPVAEMVRDVSRA